MATTRAHQTSARVPDDANGLWASTPDEFGESLRGGFLSALVLLAAGVLGVVVGRPLLFPSLGPTLYLQLEHPRLHSARPYNVIAGHAVAIVCGYLSVFVFGAEDTPSSLATHALSWMRIAASACGILLAPLLQRFLRAPHPPTAATILLITLGGFQATLSDVSTLCAGVLVVALAGEAARRYQLARLRATPSRHPAEPSERAPR